MTVPESVCADIPEGRAAAIDGLRGVGIALETVATLALMCDPRDLGTTLGDTAPESAAKSDGIGDRDGANPIVPRRVRGGPTPGYNPTLFVYEHVPGGIGLAERIFAQRELFLARARRLVESCPCAAGCPACVGPALEGAPPLPEALAASLSSAEGPRRQHPRATGRKAVALELMRRALGNLRSVSVGATSGAHAGAIRAPERVVR
jgi:ATP-dependent helicase YprA (DUF1998 family)